MRFKGTKSMENLLAAFAGESQAREEGSTEIAEMFEKMAVNETAYAPSFSVESPHYVRSKKGSAKRSHSSGR